MNRENMENDSLSIKNTSAYKEFSTTETLKLLQSSINGLTEVETKQRLLKFGFNEVSEKKNNPFLAFLKTLLGPYAVATRIGNYSFGCP